MLYTNLKIGENNLQLRLTTLMSKKLKDDTGKSPLELLVEGSQKESLEILLKIVEYSSKALQPNISEEEVYNLYDEFVDEGYGIFELFALVREILRASGQGFTKHPPEMAELLIKMGIEVPEKYIETEEEIKKR